MQISKSHCQVSSLFCGLITYLFISILVLMGTTMLSGCSRKEEETSAEQILDKTYSEINEVAQTLNQAMKLMDECKEDILQAEQYGNEAQIAANQGNIEKATTLSEKTIECAKTAIDNSQKAADFASTAQIKLESVDKQCSSISENIALDESLPFQNEIRAQSNAINENLEAAKKLSSDAMMYQNMATDFMSDAENILKLGDSLNSENIPGKNIPPNGPNVANPIESPADTINIDTGDLRGMNDNIPRTIPALPKIPSIPEGPKGHISPETIDHVPDLPSTMVLKQVNGDSDTGRFPNNYCESYLILRIGDTAEFKRIYGKNQDCTLLVRLKYQWSENHTSLLLDLPSNNTFSANTLNEMLGMVINSDSGSLSFPITLPVQNIDEHKLQIGDMVFLDTSESKPEND